MARRLIAALTLAACAHQSAGPPVITPKEGERASGPRDLSEGGQQRGVVEFALGGVTAGLSATLITLGAVQLARALEIRDFCDEERRKRMEFISVGAFSPPLDPACEPSPLGVDPYVDAKVSSALSFAFSAPIAVASAFLFRRAVRTRRDYRAQKAERGAAFAAPSLTPYASQQGGGLRFGVRF